MAELKDLIEKLPVLNKLSISEKQKIVQGAKRREYEEGEYLVFSGEVWPYVILIEEGMIEILKESKEGRSLALRTLEAGDMFWGHALFDGEPTPGTFQVAEKTVLYQWHGDIILPVVQDNKRALWDLSILLMKRMRQASKTIDDMAFQPVVNRLAKVLLEQYDVAEGIPVHRSLTLDEMAIKVGTTREVVCRLLYKFSDAGLIEVTQTHLTFKNKTALERVASE